MKLFLVLLGLSTNAWAEYRAFELVIVDSATGQERIEISTLTPAQYRQFHAVKSTESVSYRATWMCRGSTAHRARTCPNPKQ
ncbi:MAG: hypothetical protein KF799_10215 [Bdellovibrionales bacterium]|nr:hypothetical protein [Bdellovibrionales bacterium]